MTRISLALADAAASEPSGVGTMIQFLAAGLMVVLITLIILAIFCAAMGFVFQSMTARASHGKPLSVGPAEEEFSRDLVAVISAAVATSLDQPHRVIHLHESTSEGTSWALGGRFKHHASHQVQRKDRQ